MDRSRRERRPTGFAMQYEFPDPPDVPKRSKSATRKSPARQPTKSPARKSPGRRKPSPSRVVRSVTPPRKSPGRTRRNQTSPPRKSPARKSPSRNRTATPPRKPTARRQLNRTESSTSRSKSPVEKKPSEEKNAKKSSRIVEKVKEKYEEIRNSLTPEKALIEEVVRNSVSRFEEVAADVVGTVKRTTRSTFRSEVSASKTPEREGVTIIQENNVNAVSSVEKALVTKEYGNWFVALFIMLLMPVIYLSAQLACTPDSCSLALPKVFISFKKLVDKDAILWYSVFYLAQFILGSLPLGPKSEGLSSQGHKLSYRNNGIAVLVLNIAVLAGIHFYLLIPVTKVLEKVIPIMVTVIITSLILSIGLYAKAIYTKVPRNPYGNTGNAIYDMFAGVEINPRIGPLDVKMTVMRTAFVSAIIYNALILLKEYETNAATGQYSLPTIVLCILQISYVLDGLIFESSLLTSFTVNQESTGYFFVMSISLFPFWDTLMTKYLFLMKPKEKVWIVVVSVLLHIIGYTFYRLATSQKGKFVRHPSSVYSQDVIKERRSGTNLYKGGLWGVVRHPKYTGVIMMYISWGILAGILTSFHWIPIAIPLVVILQHIALVYKVEARSAIRHYTAWPSYTRATKYRLLPYVF